MEVLNVSTALFERFILMNHVTLFLYAKILAILLHSSFTFQEKQDWTLDYWYL